MFAKIIYFRQDIVDYQLREAELLHSPVMTRQANAKRSNTKIIGQSGEFCLIPYAQQPCYDLWQGKTSV